jgi:D-serine deaminase-like pyridoxal phosphate-dependent protein
MLLLNLDILVDNVAQMQTKANAFAVDLRPHGKTHKCAEIAQQQMAAGAVGITVATLKEAQDFAASGIKSIRIAKPVVPILDIKSIIDLQKQGFDVSFCVDSEKGARLVSQIFQNQQETAQVLLEVDVNYGRTGVAWNKASSIDFYGFVQKLPNINVLGILCHAGQSYFGPAHEGETLQHALRRAALEERGMMLSFAHRLQAAGFAQPQNFEISIGSTPSVVYFEQQERSGFKITEIRPGNYVFNDAMQVALSVCKIENCALRIQSTLISQSGNKGFLNAGKKQLSSDTGFQTNGYGLLFDKAGNRLEKLQIHALSEEHAWLKGDFMGIEIGDSIEIIPNHVCVAVHLSDKIYVQQNGKIVEEWKVMR